MEREKRKHKTLEQAVKTAGHPAGEAQALASLERAISTAEQLAVRLDSAQKTANPANYSARKSPT